ncbi:hypothetical protein RJ639_016648 [Escallonia herrerae]|uniref:C2H2-type domain-containing protein n=1 Tax=Escallonia herrerae TaxID=1293975 RepID=A0AA88VEN7_9ASTE|nr:hypothetical protein RJ639_016648 [Escallonia herrerae]
MTVKRDRDGQDVEALAMANCLNMLSRLDKATEPPADRVFKCKTCDRQFLSFQALGGHRASHKKLKLAGGQSPREKPKTHECSICGMEFSVGQALGGHMRRHRNDGLMQIAVPVTKKSSDSKRVWGLDLNLTPYENDLKLGITYDTSF